MQTRQPDSVIAEVHAVRDAYAARFDYDVGRMFRDLQARQRASDHKYVCLPARRPSTDLKGRENDGSGVTSGQYPTKGT